MESGTKLGHYEISTLLGKGGMGEVYSAIETRLSRTIGVKLIPKHSADNPFLRFLKS